MRFYIKIKITIMKKIGLTLEQFADIKASCEKGLKNNCAANCGDFDTAFIKIVNEVLSELNKVIC